MEDYKGSDEADVAEYNLAGHDMDALVHVLQNARNITDKPVDVGGILIGIQDAAIIGVSVLTLGLLYLLFNRTRLGLAMRAAALEGEQPAGVLDRSNRLLLHENTGMVTAMFGILDPVSLTFDYASAGHPPAMHGRPSQPVEKVASKGLPLGLFVDNRYVQQRVQLEQGSLLAFYTDGLVEFDRDVVSGEQLLAEAVQAEANGETPDPAVAIVRRLIFGVPKDDIAVLTVAISALPLEAVDVTTQATPASARVLRQSLRRLALSIGLDESRTFDLLVAAGAAISNAIAHAYGHKDGSVHVRAAREHDELIVEVQDQGNWRPPQNNGRGRGLKLMRTLMQRVDIDSNEHGTTVRLVMPLSEYAYDRSGDVPASRA